MLLSLWPLYGMRRRNVKPYSCIREESTMLSVPIWNAATPD